MKTTKIMAALLLLLASSTLVKAQNSKILGVWWNEEKTSRIEVYEDKGKIFGKIVWLKTDSDPDGKAPRTDYNNPDAKLKARKLVGVITLKNLTWDASDSEWTDGEIYDPKTGKTYSCYAELQKDGTLFLKGYVLGMPFLGKSTVWTRYK
jgi:uncharacterized protein (DUF2147 family)